MRPSSLCQLSAGLLLFRVDSRPVRQHRFGCGPAALWASTLVAVAVGWQAQAADEPTVGLTVLNSMERISQHQAPFGKSAAELCAAKNEVESFQVVVAALKGQVRVVAAELSDLAGPKGARIGKDHVKIYREEYVRVRQSTPGAELPPGLYPDPLVPLVNPLTGQPIEPLSQDRPRWGEPLVTRGHDMYGLPCDVFQGQNQPLWIDVQVPKDAPAGQYHGTFRVRIQGGRAAEIPVALTVWDFALPDGPTHRNHCGSVGNIARSFNVQRDSEQGRQIEDRYCQAMAEHRINPPIPSRLLPEVKPDGSLGIVAERHQALIVLLEKRAGPQAVQKVVDRIAPNWWDYCRDPDAILAARREIAQQITAPRGQ